MRTLFFLLLCFSLPKSAFTQTNHAVEISKTVEKYINRNGFSGTILVAQGGQPIFHQSYGLAYRSNPDTIQNDYHYSVASITKLFTSIRILQLVETGQLDLTRPLIDYLPQFAENVSKEITIHHLLLHISGLPNEPNKVYRQPSEPAQLLQKVLQKGKQNTFGQFNYSNVDYMLLGLVIEQLTKQSWAKNIEENILQLLGMEKTGFLKYGYYPKQFAYSYSKKGKRLQQDPLFYIENFYAAGNMYSTTLDLLRLDQALYSDKLLGKQAKELLSQSYPEYNYTGYGVWNYNYPFIKTQPTIMERRGGILGANSVLVRLTDSNHTIIILSNDDRFNPDSFGDEGNLREMLIRVLEEEIVGRE